MFGTDATGGGALESCQAWYVLQTKQHCEQLARAYILQRGLTAYLPRMRLWPKPTVGGEIQALFPGYLFVRLALPDDYRRAATAPGIKGYVRLEGNQPTEVPAHVIELLISREDPDGLVCCGDAAAPGARVRIGRGVLRDFSGVVEKRLSGRQRVILLISLLQRDVRIEVPEQWLRAV